MNKDTQHLIGKTIKSFNTKTINVWMITFTDGSTQEIHAESNGSNGSLGIGQLWLDDKLMVKFVS